MVPIWTWSDEKSRRNKVKHRISFELGVTALDDPLSATRADTHPDGDRFQTIGRPPFEGAPVLLVVHTDPEVVDGVLVGRIISVRKADARERQIYENQDFGAT